MAQFLKSFLLTNTLLIPAWLLLRFFRNRHNIKNGKQVSNKRELLLLLFVVYLISVASITVVPLPEFRKDEFSKPQINVIPLKTSIKGFIHIFTDVQHYVVLTNVVANFFGNIIMFIPLGLMLPLLNEKYTNRKKLLGLAAFSSLSIETIQLLSISFDIYRYVDIDDIILNTTGALIGYTIYSRIFKPSYAVYTVEEIK
jgi:glycopeptide antibiotics resistance protein